MNSSQKVQRNSRNRFSPDQIEVGSREIQISNSNHIDTLNIDSPDDFMNEDLLLNPNSSLSQCKYNISSLG